MMRHPIIILLVLILISTHLISQNLTDLPDSIMFVSDKDLIQNKNKSSYFNAKVNVSLSTHFEAEVVLVPNLTNQMLHIKKSNKYLLASKLYGFEMNSKSYRTANTYTGHYVFAEKIASGKLNLYYSQKYTYLNANTEYKNYKSLTNRNSNNLILSKKNILKKGDNFYYFITTESTQDSLEFIIDYGLFANTYLQNNNVAYKNMMEFTRRKVWIHRILLPISIIALYPVIFTSSYNNTTEKLFFAISFTSLITYFIIDRNLKPQYPTPEVMKAIFQEYNSSIK